MTQLGKAWLDYGQLSNVDIDMGPSNWYNSARFSLA